MVSVVLVSVSLVSRTAADRQLVTPGVAFTMCQLPVGSFTRTAATRTTPTTLTWGPLTDTVGVLVLLGLVLAGALLASVASVPLQELQRVHRVAMRLLATLTPLGGGP